MGDAVAVVSCNGRFPRQNAPPGPTPSIDQGLDQGYERPPPKTICSAWALNKSEMLPSLGISRPNMAILPSFCDARILARRASPPGLWLNAPWSSLPFIDDAPVAQGSDDASALAVAHLAALFRTMAAAVPPRFPSCAGSWRTLCLGEGLPAALPPLVRGSGILGDSSTWRPLPCPEPPTATASRYWHRHPPRPPFRLFFLLVRDAVLDGLYPSFAAAFAAAKAWSRPTQGVRAAPGYRPPPVDRRLGRHVLIYGSCRRYPEARRPSRPSRGTAASGTGRCRSRGFGGRPKNNVA